MSAHRPRPADPAAKALFVSEVRADLDDGMVHLAGYMPGDGAPVSHIVMSGKTFRQLLADGRRKLAKGSH